MARRGLASAGGDIASSPVRASSLSRVPAAREKAMQAALISILTGKYIQTIPIAHCRQEPPSRFVRLISGPAQPSAVALVLLQCTAAVAAPENGYVSGSNIRVR